MYNVPTVRNHLTLKTKGSALVSKDAKSTYALPALRAPSSIPCIGRWVYRPVQIIDMEVTVTDVEQISVLKWPIVAFGGVISATMTSVRTVFQSPLSMNQRF